MRSFYFAGASLLLLTATAPAVAQWVQVPTPNPSTTRNILRGISGTSATDVWTVGHKELPSTGSTNLADLVLHYDGVSWREVAPPNPAGANFADLFDVVAPAPADVWAVGDYSGPGTGSGTQLLHYDGSGWAPAQPAGGHPVQSFLWGLDALSSTDVWAAGGYIDPNAPMLQTLGYVLRYDGSIWTQQPVPPVGTFRNRFDAVSALTPNDVWAVGTFGDNYGDFRHLIMHYDGTAWRNSPLPANLINTGGELLDVRAIAPNDVWAVGDVTTGGIMMLHYDGIAWSRVASHGGGGAFAALGPNDIWAVGAAISHWDGTSWTKVDSLSQFPNPALGAATVLPNGEVWAAGRVVDTSNVFSTLVYRNPTATPQVRIAASGMTMPLGGNVQLTALPSAPGNYQFSWSPAAGLSNAAIANPVASPSATTTYTVTMTNLATGAVAQATVLLRVGTTTGVSPDNGGPIIDLALQAWPNPFTGALTCNVTASRAEVATLTMIDALGRVVGQQTAQLHAGDNAIPFLAPAGSGGVYMLTVQTADHRRRLRLTRE